MSDRTRTWLLLALLVAVAVTVPTGALSSASLDRGMTVTVAADEDAYLGIEIEPLDIDTSQLDEVTLAAFENQFARRISLSVTVADPTPTREPTLENVITPTDQPLDVGDETTVEADVICNGSAATEEVALDITVTGDGVRMTADRTVTITCG